MHLLSRSVMHAGKADPPITVYLGIQSTLIPMTDNSIVFFFFT